MHPQRGQMLDSYRTQLNTLAANCEFETLEENLIPDQVVRHFKDKPIQEGILRESNIILQKVKEYIKARNK